jgi:Cu(I)/Ag(I) efflux system protein CusF
MKSSRIVSLIATAATAATAASLNAIAADMGGMHMDKATQPTNGNAAETKAMSMTDGEVRKIDKEAGKITIKHGPIVNLGMPGMTMVFRVKDAAMLDQVKVGDKIKFVAERSDGSLSVSKIEAIQ